MNISSEAGLRSAIENLQSNTTLVLAPGKYYLQERLHIHDISNVTIRGATGRRDDVVLFGRGMTNANYGGVPDAIMLERSEDVTIADLAIRNVYTHAITLNAGTERPHLRNLHLVNAGEQFVKANPDDQGGGVDGGIVEFCRIEYSTSAPSYYTNGVDVHTGTGWTIRHNVFRNIRAEGDLAGPAILVWNGSRGTLTEGNLFLNVQRAIHYGMREDVAADHQGGVIRNNFIHRSAGQSGDVGISIVNSPNAQVLHNTVVLNGTYGNAIEYRFPGSQQLQIHNNLTDAAIVARDGAKATVSSNLTNAQAWWFVDAVSGNLHLRSTSPAIDRAAVARAGIDYDRQARPSGLTADVGADEYVPLAVVADSAPVLSVGGNLSYQLNSRAILVGAGAKVTDADSANFAGGRLRLHIGEGSDSSNRLSIRGNFMRVGSDIFLSGEKIGRLISSGVGTTDLIVAFTARATPSVVEDLLHSITFRTVGGSSTIARSILFALSDGDGTISQPRTKMVVIS